MTKKSMDNEVLRRRIVELLKSAGASSTEQNLNLAVMNMLKILPPPVIKLRAQESAPTASWSKNKKPDFVFPSATAYHDQHFPDFKLHMLASKTCCKDRWRQVITEADRIRPKHLFTLQEGVSSNQLAEMYQHDIVLVVPQPIMKSFPEEFRSQIMNLTGFVEYIRESQRM